MLAVIRYVEKIYYDKRRLEQDRGAGMSRDFS